MPTTSLGVLSQCLRLRIERFVSAAAGDSQKRRREIASSIRGEGLSREGDR